MSLPSNDDPASAPTLSVDTSTRARSATTATVPTIYENDITSPLSGGRSSSQFRLRRAPTASKDYQIQSAGQDPGLDPDGVGGDMSSTLHTDCQITVVEFSEERIVQQDFWNEGLREFLQKPREEWVKVRWINCNGLSWDIIQQLARHYNFHSLALEDLLARHDNNRPKCDWYFVRFIPSAIPGLM
ncbi:hypothetical protein BDD12DRAFT_183029 [Trichophaea hybrida]|nr:hypothetical protein BDD12DRAFT_183029 [Trichophaea hybrida]